MIIHLQVKSVQLLDDGTSVVWLIMPLNEPGTAAPFIIPAFCPHQNVNVGDWYGISLTLI